MRVIGYGLTTKGEADKYMEATMSEFKRLCDDTIILCNNAGPKEKALIKKYGFKMVEDNRIWGENQNLIKQDFLKNHVAKLNPEFIVCLDSDEVFEKRFTRQELESLSWMWGMHFYIVNLWNEGYKSKRCFWNVRAFKWTGETEFVNKPVHPGLAPKFAYFVNQYAPFLVIHYGLKEKADREKKIARYKKYDPNQKYCSPEYYNDLASDTWEPFNEEKVHNEVTKEVLTYKQQRKELKMTIEKKYINIRALNGKVYDVLARDVELYRKQGCEILPPTPEPVPVELPKVNELECSICGFTAKTKAGLSVHSKKHK